MQRTKFVILRYFACNLYS